MGKKKRLLQRKGVEEKDLSRWKLIEDFQARLGRLRQKHGGVGGRLVDPRRKLELESYLSLFLFGLLNPVLRTMRGLCAASGLKRMQEEVSGRAVSLGSFSETQSVVEPELLKEVFEALVEEVSHKAKSQCGEKEFKPLEVLRWLAVDSTLWEVLPRMGWAHWRTQGRRQNAVRLHVGYNLLEEHPHSAGVTTGKICERKAWKQQWEAGNGYVGDRYYGEAYKLFEELDEAGCYFVLRLRESASIEVEEELPVSEAQRQAGVIRSGWGYLGCKKKYRSMRVRLVWVDTGREELILVSNLTPQQLGAELVAELYRKRWQVELFFRWVKCILGNRHWFAQSQRGVSMQIYLALIAGLLLQLYTGVRPNKRMMETIQLYLMGVASLEELEQWIMKELARMEKQAAKKS